MKIHRFRHVALIGTAVVSLALTSAPSRGQMLVYDPSNYAQNVLQAARALQQINNQITSLQNQTQMLLNQARNLASLPYSSLRAIEQSMARTQQLINQAQRLAYDINKIDQAFAPILIATPARPRRSNSSATRSRAGITRWPHTRTLSAFRLAWCKPSTPRAPRPARSSRRANQR